MSDEKHQAGLFDELLTAGRNVADLPEQIDSLIRHSVAEAFALLADSTPWSKQADAGLRTCDRPSRMWPPSSDKTAINQQFCVTRP